MDEGASVGEVRLSTECNSGELKMKTGKRVVANRNVVHGVKYDNDQINEFLHSFAFSESESSIEALDLSCETKMVPDQVYDHHGR